MFIPRVEAALCKQIAIGIHVNARVLKSLEIVTGRPSIAKARSDNDGVTQSVNLTSDRRTANQLACPARSLSIHRRYYEIQFLID